MQILYDSFFFPESVLVVVSDGSALLIKIAVGISTMRLSGYQRTACRKFTKKYLLIGSCIGPMPKDCLIVGHSLKAVRRER